eukprot:9132002-Pyramimonas_sp.AAC.1
MHYLRVAANVSDPFAHVTECRLVAFKSQDAGASGPFGSVDTMSASQRASLLSFLHDHTDASPIKTMFDPDTTETTTLVDAPKQMIAFHDTVFASADASASVSPVDDSGQAYYVYV